MFSAGKVIANAGACFSRVQAISLFVNTYAFDKAVAERLVANGINSPAAFEGVEASDLVGFGFTEEEAAGLIAKVSGA